jgi:hypothetical protein
MKLADKIKEEREALKCSQLEAENNRVDAFSLPDWIIHRLAELKTQDCIMIEINSEWFCQPEHEYPPANNTVLDESYFNLLTKKLEREGFTIYYHNAYPTNGGKRAIDITLSK